MLTHIWVAQVGHDLRSSWPAQFVQTCHYARRMKILLKHTKLSCNQYSRVRHHFDLLQTDCVLLFWRFWKRKVWTGHPIQNLCWSSSRWLIVQGRRVNCVWLESSPHFISDFVDADSKLIPSNKAPILKTGPSQALAPDVFYCKKNRSPRARQYSVPKGARTWVGWVQERLPCHQAPIQCRIGARLFLSI